MQLLCSFYRIPPGQTQRGNVIRQHCKVLPSCCCEGPGGLHKTVNIFHQGCAPRPHDFRFHKIFGHSSQSIALALAMPRSKVNLLYCDMGRSELDLKCNKSAGFSFHTDIKMYFLKIKFSNFRLKVMIFSYEMDIYKQPVELYCWYC